MIIDSIAPTFLAFGIVLGAALRLRATRAANRYLKSRCPNTDGVTGARHTQRSRPSGTHCAGRDDPKHPRAVMPVPAFASTAHQV